MVNIPLSEIETFNFEKYKNDGWGLSRKEFEELFSLFTSDFFLKTGNLNIVEFGSGRSTEFFVDIMNQYDLGSVTIKLYSFDDSTEYAYKGKHPNLQLNIVPLVECTDDIFNKMFVEKKYDANLMPLKHTPLHTRQKNTFYKVEDSMLPETIDLLIVDGPHGNGRSLAFLRCVDKLVPGTVILIDDASHYPFYEHLSKLVKTEILYKQHIRESKWEKGGDFILCKVF